MDDQRIHLPFDIISHILDNLRGDYGSLYQASLTNWQLNHGVSRLLYACVQYSPPFQHELNLRDRGTLSVCYAGTERFNARNLHNLYRNLRCSGQLAPLGTLL